MSMPSEKRAEFEKDFQWLTTQLKWTAQDIAEARTAMESDTGLIRYLWVLARAMKAGYRHGPDSGARSLIDFCAKNGLPSPQSKGDV